MVWCDCAVYRDFYFTVYLKPILTQWEWMILQQVNIAQAASRVG